MPASEGAPSDARRRRRACGVRSQPLFFATSMVLLARAALSPSSRRGVARAFSNPAAIASRQRRFGGRGGTQSVRLATGTGTCSATDARDEAARFVVASRGDLEGMTVKELKSYMTSQGIVVPRGQGSKLKLKGQIVEFIWNHRADDGEGADVANGGVDGADDVRGADGEIFEDETPSVANGGVNGADDVRGANEHKTPSSTPRRRGNLARSARTGMPPLPPVASIAEEEENEEEVDNDDDDDDDDESDVTPTATASRVVTAKDRIFLDVLNRYPPLRESVLRARASSAGGANDEEITLSNIHEYDPSLLDYVVPSGVGEDDVRQRHHPVLRGATQSDMDLIFVGTASCAPGITRGVSCTALRLNWRGARDGRGDDRAAGKDASSSAEQRAGHVSGTWLFDCGESTQLSIQRTPSVKPGKISKIFVTHCHGDHSFGLPGLLCLMGTDRDRSSPPVEIHGPEGLRMWLRAAIRYSVSRVVPPYRVHELMDVPMAPEWTEGRWKNGRYYFQLGRERENRANGDGRGNWRMQGLAGEDPTSWISRAPMLNLEASRDFGEVDGGRDIFPAYDHPLSHDGAPVWEVVSEDDVAVRAAPMSHGVPCVGYVVEERDQPGRLQPELVREAIERNREGLKAAGIRNPMKVMATVKDLPVGGSYEFPDGTVLRQEDVVEPPRRGRKVVICGDTANSRALEGLGKDADVLVHEATNTFLPGVDKDGDLKLVTKDAKIHGHSTPYMAGEFAKRINAKTLCLNHFSARYKGDQSIESMTIMTRMERQALKASGLPEDAVAAAWDFMVLPVARTG
ncbi:hypothetical protein ACHAWF_011979 [Thalassiosira exigua]